MGELEKRAGNIWKKAEIKASWSAQDCMTLDSVPYIGVFSRLRPYWLVATGFGKGNDQFYGFRHGGPVMRLLDRV